MKVWKRKGYEVVEVEFDGDLHEFEIVRDGEVKAIITPADIEDMHHIIDELDNGVDPIEAGWEDGMGNTLVL